MNYIFSFFSGAGLWDNALKEIFTIVKTNEINSEFYKGYRANNEFPLLGNMNFDFSEILTNKNLKNFINNEIKILRKSGFVGFVGGSPCIDFSVAGKNLGGNGIHGGLFGAFIQSIVELKPDFFIIENVPGLIESHYEYFKKEYVKLNYDFNINYIKINAMQFGVPQNRYRIFIYGINKNLTKNLNIDINDYTKFSIEELKKIKWPKPTEFKKDSIIINDNDIPSILTVNHWWKINDVINHPNNQDWYSHKHHKNLDLKEGERKSQRHYRIHRYSKSNTLCFGNGRNIPGHPYKLRSISIAECLAIQSMPKSFYLPNTMSLPVKFRVVANGVPYEMGYAIGKAMSDFLCNL